VADRSRASHPPAATTRVAIHLASDARLISAECVPFGPASGCQRCDASISGRTGALAIHPTSAPAPGQDVPVKCNQRPAYFRTLSLFHYRSALDHFESQLPLPPLSIFFYLSDVVLGSSAFSRCLREKGLNLLPHFIAFAAGAFNPFFVVLADRHYQSETLATIFAKIFVKRHRNPPLEFL